MLEIVSVDVNPVVYILESVSRSLIAVKVMTAPIVLFAYNRPSHTRATLEALARNTLAAQSDLVIFSDAPKDDAAASAVREVREVLAGVTGFASVRVVERERNMGLARSVIAGVTELLDAHGRVIVLEDDLVTSRHFLQYMNDALDYYADDPKAFSIGGYQFPARTMAIPMRYRHDTYASYRCCSWGWATWRDRWARIDWDMGYIDAFMADREQQARFNRGGPDMTQMLMHQHQGRIDSWAIRFCHAHFANDMRCIYPVKSLVSNIGLDNSGVHCGVDPRRQHDSLDEAFIPSDFCRADPVEPELAAAFYQAFCPPPPEPEPLTPRVVLRKSRSFVRHSFHIAARVAARVRRFLFRPVQDVDILLVNTMQKSGGAARAAWRTFLGVSRGRPGARYLTLVKDDLRADVVGRYHWSLKGVLAVRFASLDRIPMARYPQRLPVTFTPAKWINPLRVPLSRFRPRLVHLHWLASSLLRVEDLGRIRAPVVWTLHDTWAFTGGCHYTGDCGGFQSRCGRCPQLGSERDDDLSREIWLRKQKAYGELNLTVVAPSRWLAELARRSSLFAGRRIEIIPNGLDTDVFCPLDKAAAKTFLGIDAAHPVLLFGAQWLTDRRKGGDLLAAALAKIEFPCTLLTFGEGQLALTTNPNLAVRSLGSLSDDVSLALMYSAADVFLCPSREDNLPNTVAEAMACGTPCVAFDANGLPDMVTHQVDGWLAKAFDPEDLARGIRWILSHPQPEVLRNAARAKAVAEYSLDVMSARYAALYSELTGGLHQ
ncbi:glycosyltransferase [Azoarcus sp. TTM-91]|uniref:glycosyltransferase n=1 Tax=Azoarcus sp. TTM-91 TaxID=2691581 RepID=UPI00145C65AB|nr:glycosyltransferase [Azoarcus sp. TTM-91]NMG33878.1 glycosyltransferase [Azoarcus sp. TTM-91]